MKIHRLAKYFPVLEGEEFDLLVEDIKKNGQQEPIVLYQGEILDGVNRFTACEKLGIVPITKEYKGSDPLAYVISENIRRRHMDASQRAMLAQEMLPEFEKEATERIAKSNQRGVEGRRSVGSQDPTDEHRARDDAALHFGVSGPTIQRAKRIKREAPEKVDAIISGKTTVAAVDKELRAKAEAARPKKKSESKLVTNLEQQKYISILEQIVSLLPKKPPQNWEDKSFSYAKGFANIIIRRLEVFNGNDNGTKALS